MKALYDGEVSDAMKFPMYECLPSITDWCLSFVMYFDLDRPTGIFQVFFAATADAVHN